jgi:hypothetical protein
MVRSSGGCPETLDRCATPLLLGLLFKVAMPLTFPYFDGLFGMFFEVSIAAQDRSTCDRRAA